MKRRCSKNTRRKRKEKRGTRFWQTNGQSSLFFSLLHLQPLLNSHLLIFLPRFLSLFIVQFFFCFFFLSKFNLYCFFAYSHLSDRRLSAIEWTLGLTPLIHWTFSALPSRPCCNLPPPKPFDTLLRTGFFFFP